MLTPEKLRRPVQRNIGDALVPPNVAMATLQQLIEEHSGVPCDPHQAFLLATMDDVVDDGS